MADLKNFQEHSEDDKKARWFIFSYDAGEEITAKRLDENKKEVEYKRRKYSGDDFRKAIIEKLLIRKVTEVEQMVETTIIFLDPDSSYELPDKLKYWEEVFDSIGKDFNYVIAPIVQFPTTGKIEGKYYRAFVKNSLQNSFKKLFDDLKLEYDKKHK